METTTPITVEALLSSHGAWVRRLARGLIRDDAEDLAQDTWEATLRRPPRYTEGLRGWLAKVASNRARNLARASGRRRARETAAAPAADEVASSPEDLAGAVELQRTIAELIARLPEGQRQVVYLRYFEDLDSSQIGRKLGVPAGTVRWRLKEGLDGLRRELDQRHGGDRRRWMVLIAPIALAKTSAPRWVIAGVAAAVLGVAALVLWPARFQDLPVAERAAILERARGPIPAPPSFRGGQPLPALVAAAVAPACPASAELNAVLETRRAELAERETHDVQFARGAPNPEAERRFGAFFAELVQREARCAQTLLGCRGSICKYHLLIPLSLTERDCWSDRAALRERLHHRCPSTVGNAGPTFDPISRQPFTRYDYHWHLATSSGAPLAPEAQPRLRSLQPGLLARRPIPAGLSATCRADAERVLRELRAVEERLSEVVVEDEAFPASAPNPAAEPEVKREVARLLGLEGKPFPFALTCRGGICSIAPGDANEPAAALPWDCLPSRAGLEVCNVDRKQPSWFRRLEEASRRGESQLLGSGFPPYRRDGVVHAGYLHLLPEGHRQRKSPLATSCAFGAEVRAARLFERCEAEHPARGLLHLKTRIPGGPEVIEPRPRVTHEIGGPLGGTPFARCVADGLAAIAERFEVPTDLRNGLVGHGKLELPGVEKIWARHLERCRGIEAR